MWGKHYCTKLMCWYPEIHSMCMYLHIRTCTRLYLFSSNLAIFCLASSIRPSTSSLDRLKFSMLNAYTVNSVTPKSRHHSRVSLNFSKPEMWPSMERLYCIFRANLLLPSIIMATCRGICPARRTRQHSLRNQSPQLEPLVSSMPLPAS